MNIRSAKFIKSIVSEDEIFEEGIPRVVFIGRSNVGKSSVINSVTNQNKLAVTSSFPGRTQRVNVFLINKDLHLVDLPGYGFAKVPKSVKRQIQELINWFLFESDYTFKKVVLIIDAEIGPTGDDMDMLYSLERDNKEVLIVANKIDKIKKSEYEKQMQRIQNTFNSHKIIPYSAEKKIGVGILVDELLK